MVVVAHGRDAISDFAEIVHTHRVDRQTPSDDFICWGLRCVLDYMVTMCFRDVIKKGYF